jgi:hypothetical protein
MNDAEYMGADVHRAMIAGAALGAAVCVALAKCRSKSCGKNEKYVSAEKPHPLFSCSDGRDVPSYLATITWQQSRLHGRAQKPVELRRFAPRPCHPIVSECDPLFFFRQESPVRQPRFCPDRFQPKYSYPRKW